jgi:Ala-tRNA(Pro) deacylase
MPHPTPQLIHDFLDRAAVAYRRTTHAPTRTSQDSADARGESLRHGAKAILLKLDDVFALFVLSAAAKLHSSAVKARLRAKSIRFATPEELLALTGLVTGSVPPFGEPVLPFPLYVDESIATLGHVSFNAASLTESISMSADDYLNAARPNAVFSFSR